MEVEGVLTKAVAEASASIAGLVIALAGVGTLSMALIQAAKDLIPLRRFFHRWWIRNWLTGMSARVRIAAESERPFRSPAPSPELAETELVRLSTNGDASAFYDLPIEQLCGQMTAALQVALDYPLSAPHLVAVLGAMADPQDVDRVFRAAELGRMEASEPSPREVDALVGARNRVAHQIQRGIDALQIAAGFRWKWTLQLAAVILSGLIAVWAYAAFGNPAGSVAAVVARSLLVFLVAGILGGFLAPVARDLVATLQTVRGRR